MGMFSSGSSVGFGSIQSPAQTIDPKTAKILSNAHVAQVSAPVQAELDAFKKAQLESNPDNYIYNLSSSELNTDKLVGGLYDKYINQRISSNLAAQRSPNTKALLNEAMAASKGLGSRANAALRSNALAQVNQQRSAALRDLRGQMGAQGVRGGLASSLNAQQQAKGVEAVSAAERNLVADNMNYKLQGLQTAAMYNTNQENVERDMMKNKLEAIMTMRGQNMGLQGAKYQADASSGGGGK